MEINSKPAVCQQTIWKNGLPAKQSHVPRIKPQCFCAFRADKNLPGSVPIRQRHPSQLRERSAHVGATAANRGNREPLATKSFRDIPTRVYKQIKNADIKANWSV